MHVFAVMTLWETVPDNTKKDLCMEAGDLSEWNRDRLGVLYKNGDGFRKIVLHIIMIESLRSM